MKKHLKKLKNAGFTLAEMIIVIAIFGVISSIALFDQARLSSSTLLTNMAYEVALAVREAQLYGISVRSSESGDFSQEAGMYVNIARPKEVLVYSNVASSDNPGFDAGIGEERAQYVFSNQRTNRIKAICVGNLETSGAPTEPCGPSAFSAVSELNVVFRRPNPVPTLWAGTGGSIEEKAGMRAYIVIDTGDGKHCKVVIVEPTGQTRIVDSSSGLCENS
ncbi:MAG TPA: type II secretion system protein [Candidatus Paceibacterota bacterium]